MSRSSDELCRTRQVHFNLPDARFQTEPFADGLPTATRPYPPTGQKTQAAAGGKYYSFFPFFRRGFLA
jgi:hypothetical protein